MMKEIMVIILFAVILFGITKDYSTIKKGQNYRNFFKAVKSGIGLFANFKNEKAMMIATCSTIVLLLYILAIISTIGFLPSLMNTNHEWLIITAIVIGLSALLHVYVRFINKVMFNNDLGEADI